jgi:valyl-tRNA synthetase
MERRDRDGSAILEPVSAVLALVRRAKTEAKVSQRAAVAAVRVRAPAGPVAALEAALADLRDALTIEELTVTAAAALSVEAELSPPANT